MQKYLVVGLGNPGKEYEETRHNVGFQIVRAFAEKKGWKLKKEKTLQGWVFKGEGGEKEIYGLLPSTYMNRSGEAVTLCVKEFGVSLSRLLVVVDDVDLPFCSWRLRENSSSGGHNGLKSIEYCLQSRAYWRLRVGIGEKQEGEELAEYVLAAFSPEEKKKLPHVIEDSVLMIETWIEDGALQMKQLIAEKNLEKTL